MSKKKVKTIHYRYANLPNCSLSLQELLESSFEDPHVKKAIDRQEKPNSELNEYRLINRKESVQNALFCQLIYVKIGDAQPIVTEQSEAEYFKIDAILPHSIGSEDAEKNKREFVNAMLYFGVIENHIVVLPSTTLTARELEAHLYWFLATLTRKLPDKSTLILQSQPPRAIMEKISNSPVKNIQIGSPVVFKNSLDDEFSEQSNNTTQSFAINKNELFFDLLKTLVPDFLTKNPNMTDCLDDSNLQLKLLISYNRKTSISGQKALDTLATSLRHLNEQDLVIKLENGVTITGSDLKLSTPLTVFFTESGLYDETLLFKSMRDWLISKINAEEIEI